jgi:hypothetical protein
MLKWLSRMWHRIDSWVGRLTYPARATRVAASGKESTAGYYRQNLHGRNR